MFDAITCPSCSLSLKREGASFVCEKKHTYDLSSEGYLHLLLANQKQSLDPGDSKEMLQSRRDFLQKGFYRPLAERLDALCLDAAIKAKRPVILDLGCGEGYYARSVKTVLPEVDVYGVDISKAAARMAARRKDGVSYVVASMKKLPFSSNSIEVILSVFAPADLKECARVLRPKGKMIIVRPGPGHLREFSSALGLKEPHSIPIFDLKGITLNVASSEHVRGSMRLRSVDLRNLCRMTPIFWRTSPEAQASLYAVENLETTFDFHLSILSR